MKKFISLISISFFLSACSTNAVVNKADSMSAAKTNETKMLAVSEPEVEAKLSGEAVVTHDLEASVKFYTEYLGYKEYKRIRLDTPTAVAPFGVSSDSDLAYVGLVPTRFSKDNMNFATLNFVQIDTAQDNPFSQDAQRASVLGESMKAYSVKNLEEINRRMLQGNVPVITPYAPSFTGRSMTLTVLDPNGTRVQLYEFIQ